MKEIGGRPQKHYDNEFQVFADSFVGKIFTRLAPLLKPLDTIISFLLDLRSPPRKQIKNLVKVHEVNRDINFEKRVAQENRCK